MPRFSTVLVANRGEIARRVIRGAAAAGLRSVAVYSDADADAAHVREADLAVRLGPAVAAESYLSIDALLRAAEVSGADAVHPGYGFLSERAAFARAVSAAGLVFVGPSADVMDAMGRKDHAREIAVRAGVPVVPAAGPETTDLDAVADQVGFPLLVKAAAGGGGKGMRIVRERAALAEAIAAARREAAAAFGDDTMLFERYVEHGRHIEVQVIGDEHGHVLHVHERDCSVQRRHQKVIEEAPATVISDGVRELVTSSAVALAASVGYVNAGTVEFLVAGDDAYFLEMNTRLQVEHPVTELITGLDLVALQFGVAQGEPLPFGQDDVRVAGHAIEARVYAEDPYHGFLPQAGLAELVRWPARARVDEALRSGQRVGTWYDPMLGKVITFGATREAARRSLVQALDDTAVVGLTTNVGFLRSLADSPAFESAAIDTGWLDAHLDELVLDVPTAAWCLAAWTLASSAGSDPSHPFGRADGWRLSGPAAPVSVDLSASAGDVRTIVVDRAAGIVSGPNASRGIAALPADQPGGPDAVGARPDDGSVRLQIDGVVHTGHVIVHPTEVLVAYRGQTFRFGRPDAFAPGAAVGAASGSVAAPMPGTVLSVAVAPGDAVAEGDALVVIEAMKMELALRAPFDGVVAEVHAEAGRQVELGAVLVVVAAGPGSGAESGDGGGATR